MKKHIYIIPFALAALMPIIFMFIHHTFMEAWGPGYSIAMFMSCIVMMVMLVILGVHIYDEL